MDRFLTTDTIHEVNTTSASRILRLLVVVCGSKNLFEHDVLGLLHRIDQTDARIELWSYLNRVCWRADSWESTRSIIRSVSGIEFKSYTSGGSFWVEDDFCPLVFASLIERPSSYYQEHVLTEKEARGLVKVEARQIALDLKKHDQVRRKVPLGSLADHDPDAEGCVLASKIGRAHV